MKIFYVSFPFDEENTGDYDYCSILSRSINEITKEDTAVYLTGKKLGIEDQARNLIDMARTGVNQGGDIFYKNLVDFYNSENRKNCAKLIKKIITEDISEKKILNLQIRPPETGFVLSPEDIQELKEAEIKICITCHEYKLNYGRRWLQSTLHEYFNKADKVFFFNEKDAKNADKHATHSSFLDKQQEIPKDFSKLIISSTLKNIPSFLVEKKFTGLLKNFTFTNILETDLLVGKLEAKPAKSSQVTINFETNTMFTNGNLAIDGLYKNFKITAESIKVVGVLSNFALQEADAIKLMSKDAYHFTHEQYKIKYVLTKVPPTVAPNIKLDIDYCLKKPPNILVFGLIREGKGFYEAIEIAKEIQNTVSFLQANYTPEIQKELTLLSNIRVILAGKPSSYQLLSQIINSKFSLHQEHGILCDDIDLEKYGDKEKWEKHLHKKYESITTYSKLNFFQNIQKSAPKISKQESDKFYEILIEKQQKKPLIEKKDDPLQQFVQALSNSVIEKLPIDIYLDLTPKELEILAANTKYAVKYDEKGWANNASAHINTLAYGCILYTGWGMCTSKEIVKKMAIIFPKNKYSLKDGMQLDKIEEEREKKHHFKCTDKKLPIEDKKCLITAKNIIDDIVARESSNKLGCFSENLISTGDNISTFTQAGLLLDTDFNPIKIASDLIGSLEDLYL